MPELVELSHPHKGVGLITMDLSETGGFVSWKAADALAAALKGAREGGVRVSVLAASFEGHWYEHAWLKDLLLALEGKPTSAPGFGWFEALEELTSPDVVSMAAISGDCSGGGAELGWACDLRVAEEQAHFSQPEVQIGLTTGVGGTARLARLIGPTVTAEMILDGSPLSAQRIYELGGVNRVVPRGKALSESLAWASRLAERPHEALRALKKILKDSEELPLRQALDNEQKIFQKTAATPQARAVMQGVQDRFDAGESIRDVYGPKRT